MRSPCRRRTTYSTPNRRGVKNAKLYFESVGVARASQGFDPRGTCVNNTLLFRRFSLCAQQPLSDRSHLAPSSLALRGRDWRGVPGFQESGLIASTDAACLMAHSRSTDDAIVRYFIVGLGTREVVVQFCALDSTFLPSNHNATCGGPRHHTAFFGTRLSRRLGHEGSIFLVV